MREKAMLPGRNPGCLPGEGSASLSLLRFKRILATAGIASLFLLLLKNPSLTASAATDGLLLAARTVLPSTFPYMILSALLLTCGGADALGRLLGGLFRRLFFLPPVSAAVILMGIVSGFPVGASCVSQLYLEGKLTRDEAERMLCFCNFCGPPFILGGVSGFLGDRRAGMMIFLSQTLVMLLLGASLGLFARRKSQKRGKSANSPPEGVPSPEKSPRRPSFSLLFYDSIKKGCASMLQIVGCIVFFSILSALLEKIALLGGDFPGKSLLFPLLRGFLEISGGARAAAAAGAALGKRVAVFLSALAVGWSGISVGMQVASFALPAGLSMKRYYLLRIPSALSMALLSALLV